MKIDKDPLEDHVSIILNLEKCVKCNSYMLYHIRRLYGIG